MVLFDRPDPRMGTEDDVVGARIVAFLVDALLVGVAVAVVVGLLSSLGRVGTFLGGVVGLFGFFAYFVYLEGSTGQTLGKRLLGLVVVTADGEPVDYRDAAVRNVVRIVDVLPAFYIVGLATILFTDRSQRLGDVVADTVVTRSRRPGERL